MKDFNTLLGVSEQRGESVSSGEAVQRRRGDVSPFLKLRSYFRESDDRVDSLLQRLLKQVSLISVQYRVTQSEMRLTS